MLDFKDAILIVTHIDKIKSDSEIHNLVSVSNFNDDFLATCHREVFLRGQRKASYLPLITNEFWKDRVDKIIILNNYQIDDLFVTTLMYVISVESAEILLKHEKNTSERIKNDKLIGSLLINTFPDIQLMANNQMLEPASYNVFNKKYDSLPLLFNTSVSDFSRFSFDNIYSYLLLRPNSKNNEIIFESRKSILELLLEFEAYKDKEYVNRDNVYKPYFTPEYIESFFSDFQFGSNFTRILIGNSFPTKDTVNYIERGVFNLLEIDIWHHLIRNIINKIESEPIYKKSIYEFTKSILDKNNSLQAIKQYYIENHLKIINALSTFEILFRQFNNHFDSINIFFNKNIEKQFEITEFLKGDNSHLLSWSYLSKNNNEREKLKNKLELLMIQLSKRNTSISEMLKRCAFNPPLHQAAKRYRQCLGTLVT